MLILGYVAMVALGLLPLAAVARALDVDAERTFFLPTGFALAVAFVIGFAVCLLVGRVLGVLRFEHLHSYEERRAFRGESDTVRRRRRRRMTTARRRVAVR